jgi:bifunctional non-homologous end joining protein LigD
MSEKQKTYADKRAFDETPEPEASALANVDPATAPPGKTFVVHQHHARRLHFDLRLEMMNGDDPVLVSWAIPRNLPRKKGVVHLAVHVEDHPIDYGTFSGTIPAGNYGAGEVRIFDSGTYDLLEQAAGKLTFRLNGRRLQGVYHLFRTKSDDGKDEWLVRLRESLRPPADDLPDLSPMLATLVPDAFDDDRWLFEVKWDGIRAVAVCSEQETVLLSRRSRDITATYPELARLHDRLVALDAVVDGEIIAVAGGRPSFEALQARMNLQNEHEIRRATKAVPVSYVAFDLLYLDGASLLSVPVEERLNLLRATVVPSDKVQVSQPVRGDGRALFEAARAQKLEGILAKKLGSPYRPGRRTREWLKIKTIYDCDLVVGGWTRGEGSRSNSFGALLLGAYSDEGLRFTGSVGTGFTDAAIRDVMDVLRRLETSECPFVDDPTGVRAGRFGKPVRNPHWVKPELVARVEFREFTLQGRLRAPSFKGFVTDKPPLECRFEDIVPSVSS